MLFIVPKTVSDPELWMSSKYRKEGRIPVFSWKHKNSSFLFHANILDSNYPIKDTTVQNIHKKDEKIIIAFIKNISLPIPGNEGEKSNTSGPLHPSKVNIVKQSKPKVNLIKSMKRIERSRKISKAPVTATTGECDVYVIEILHKNEPPSSVENTYQLPDISIGNEVIEIECLNDLKESYRKLHKICTSNFSQNSEEHWFTALDNTHWLEHVSSLMSGAFQIINFMNSGASVFLLSPGNGWDRGCQLSSLAQLWMDPFYRTLRGFIILIEKEWLAFGHPFTSRSGHLTRDGPKSFPIFLQWLDCVWQTLQQFPDYFEFSNNLLVELAENIYLGFYSFPPSSFFLLPPSSLSFFSLFLSFLCYSCPPPLFLPFPLLCHSPPLSPSSLSPPPPSPSLSFPSLPLLPFPLLLLSPFLPFLFHPSPPSLFAFPFAPLFYSF